MQFTAIMASRGVKVIPFELNYTTPANDIILAVMASEAAANFDYWQRSHRDDTNRRQDFWPPLLRLARMIPAVEYIQVSCVAVYCVLHMYITLHAAEMVCFTAHRDVRGLHLHEHKIYLAGQQSLEVWLLSLLAKNLISCALLAGTASQDGAPSGSGGTDGCSGH